MGIIYREVPKNLSGFRIIWPTGFLFHLALWVGVVKGAFGAPTVSNVKFTLQNGTKLVGATYDLAGATSSIALSISIDNGTTYTMSATSVTGHAGSAVAAGTRKHIIWDIGTDWPGLSSTQVKVKVTARDLMQAGSYAFAVIPDGTPSIGNLIAGNVINNDCAWPQALHARKQERTT